MRTALILIIVLAAAACVREPATVKIRTETVEYEHGEIVLEGWLAEPDGGEGELPGVLVVHAWKGIGPHERDWAERLAREGFVVLVADIYGKGVRPETREEAAKEAGKYRADRPLMRARATVGLNRLAAHDRVDPGRVGAIGFCFGGGTVLELARGGAHVAGVVSLHGNLDTPKPESTKVLGKVLVLHGAADPHVPDEQVEAFETEMTAAGADYRIVSYEGAVHAFTDPAAGDDPSRGAAYDEMAARQAWEATLAFLRETL